MKKLLLAAALLAATTLSAKTFEGTVTYKMLGPGAARVKEMSMTFKGGKYRVETNTAGHQGIVIMDPAAKTMTVLMPERKNYMVQAIPAAKKSGSADKATLKKTGKSETIAGYKADEWLFTTAKGASMSLWGTKELGTGLTRLDQGAGGAGMEIPAELRDGFFALRMTHDGPQGLSGLEATKVEPGSVSSSLFEVPSGYTQMKGFTPGTGGGAFSGDAAARMQEAMKNMSPAQREMMEKMMKKQSGE